MNFLLIAFLSIIVNVIIAILGFIPSFFITAFNISYFGLIYGFIVCLIGESLGAIVSFYLYRKGFKKISQSLLVKYEKINKIINSKPKEQFYLVLSFRVFPYMPSGVVTYAASISNMNIYKFTIASTLGKIPALIVEVLITGGFIKAVTSKNFNIIILFLSLIVIIFIIVKIFKKG